MLKKNNVIEVRIVVDKKNPTKLIGRIESHQSKGSIVFFNDKFAKEGALVESKIVKVLSNSTFIVSLGETFESAAAYFSRTGLTRSLVCNKKSSNTIGDFLKIK